jgi:alpha-1,2-glucosyltransferase
MRFVGFKITAVSVVVAFMAVTWFVDSSYMDEEFHVAQVGKTQRYIFSNKSWEWDPKITTFPGLYFVTSGLLGAWECSLTTLRGINAIIVNTVLFLTVRRITDSSIACAAVLYPLNFFYSLLYYTDSVSTLFVLLTALTIKEKRFLLSGICGFLSVLMRQTNIVWIFGLCLSELIDRKQKRSFSFSVTLTNFWSHLLVGFGFVYFVIVVNGFSIVLGHKEYHSFSFHFAQLNYLVLTAVGASGPSEWIHIVKGLKHFRQKKTWIIVLFLFSVVAASVGTVVHPFILSDNRHYSFYFFKYFLSRPWIRCVVIPAVVSVSLISSRILNPAKFQTIRMPLFWFCTLTCIIPTPLIEFRYFNIPITLLLCSQRVIDKRVILFFLFVNIVTVYIFVFRPFVGVDGSVARFMY